MKVKRSRPATWSAWRPPRFAGGRFSSLQREELRLVAAEVEAEQPRRRARLFERRLREWLGASSVKLLRGDALAALGRAHAGVWRDADGMSAVFVRAAPGAARAFVVVRWDASPALLALQLGCLELLPVVLGPSRHDIPPLARQQRRVLRLLRAGARTGEMCEQLGVNAQTLATHLNLLFSRFGAGSRAELTSIRAFALKRVSRRAARSLSPRQREVYEALATGAREKDIAALLGISPHTVHTHAKAILRKLGVPQKRGCTHAKQGVC